MVGIYKITSPSGKVYIGQSWNVRKRFTAYRSLNKLAMGVKLYNSLFKHGIDNHSFEIVHELPADIEQQILDQYEQLYMDCYKEAGIKLLNSKSAGSHGKHSEETKKKCGLARLDKPLSPEHKKALVGSYSALGVYPSKMTREKMSRAARKRKPNRARNIIQLDLNKQFLARFNSAAHASRSLHIGRTSIKNNLCGYSAKSGGFIFQYDLTTFSNN